MHAKRQGPGRKEFVREDKHRIRRCRQTERARAPASSSRHVRQSPRGSDDKHATQEAVSRRPPPPVPPVLYIRRFLLALRAALVPRHVQTEDYEETHSRNTFSVGDTAPLLLLLLLRSPSLSAASSKPICFGAARAWHDRGTRRGIKSPGCVRKRESYAALPRGSTTRRLLSLPKRNALIFARSRDTIDGRFGLIFLRRVRWRC